MLTMLLISAFRLNRLYNSRVTVGRDDKGRQKRKAFYGKIIMAENPLITSQCIRIPVSDGHLAAVFVRFNDNKNKPSKDEIINLWTNYKGLPQELDLPSAPKQFIKYFEEDNRPQTKLDRDLENGMAITAGRLREDHIYDYKFIGLSHNTLRGAAGGGVLIGELLYKQGYISKK